MTVGELISYNSSLASGEGTVEENLKHIRIQRNSFNSANVKITSKKLDSSVNNGIIAVDIKTNRINASVTSDDLEILNNNKTIGVQV